MIFIGWYIIGLITITSWYLWKYLEIKLGDVLDIMLYATMGPIPIIGYIGVWCIEKWDKLKLSDIKIISFKKNKEKDV